MKIVAELDLSELTVAVRAAISGAVMATAGKGQVAWQRAVYDARGIWMEEKDRYVNSIQTRQDGDFAAEIFTDYSGAKEIEEGRPAKDLKDNLQTAKRTRLVAKGKHAGQKYLIIPFRHNVPGNTAHAKAMPPDIYAQAKELVKGRVVSEGARLSASGHLVPQKHYDWGGRLPAGLAPKLKEHHTTDIYAGMVRFDTSSGKQKSSQYLTFRIMGEWQDNKWIVPAKPGLYLAKQTAEALGPVLQKTMDEALAG